MTAQPRLSTLLSQALVAFTIEFDNEFEHRMPHRTTVGGASGKGPWLVSMAMWLNCMRHVGEDWMPVSELVRLARTETNLPGMLRWRYIDVNADPADRRANSDLMLRSTAWGRQAREVWQPLDGVIEERWRQRFGAGAVSALRRSLVTLGSSLDPALPDCMPILRYGLFTRHAGQGTTPLQPSPADATSGDLPLAALLARPLVAFASDFEGASDLSLAITADVLRLLDKDGLPLQDIPRRAGVSKESIAMALGILEKARIAISEPNPAAARGKVVRLTGAGRVAQRRARDLLDAVDQRWVDRFGATSIDGVRTALIAVVGARETQPSPLFAGLEPYPDGWRASVRTPETLPYFPMVLHRGGYPDGS